MLNREIHLNADLFLKEVEKKATRDAIGEALIDIAENDKDIVVLTADWEYPARLSKFKEKFPDRFIEVGIAEQNMAGIAAGLAIKGKKPYIVSLAIFNPGRNWEQIRLAVAFSNLNVKIVSTHAGLSHHFDGGMAQALEDIALMRTLPNMKVISPIDFIQAKKAIAASAKLNGPMYIRLGRDETPLITTQNTPFDINKALLLVKGTDVTILATGTVAYEALLTAKDLSAKHKMSAEVIACSCIKPLDEEAILASIKKTNKAVTIEDHQIAGGFGGAVAELLSSKLPTQLIRIGMDDTFGESAQTYEELKDKYGISAHHIAQRIIKQYT